MNPSLKKGFPLRVKSRRPSDFGIFTKVGIELLNLLRNLCIPKSKNDLYTLLIKSLKFINTF